MPIGRSFCQVDLTRFGGHTRGWWHDRRGVWWVVDACAKHADSVGVTRPGLGSILGHSTGRTAPPRRSARPRAAA